MSVHTYLLAVDNSDAKVYVFDLGSGTAYHSYDEVSDIIELLNDHMDYLNDAMSKPIREITLEDLNVIIGIVSQLEKLHYDYGSDLITVLKMWAYASIGDAYDIVSETEVDDVLKKRFPDYEVIWVM